MFDRIKADIQEMLNLTTELSIKDFDYLRMTPTQRKTIPETYFSNIHLKRMRLIELKQKYDL
jgi:hypothetical protein